MEKLGIVLDIEGLDEAIKKIKELEESLDRVNEKMNNIATKKSESEEENCKCDICEFIDELEDDLSDMEILYGVIYYFDELYGHDTELLGLAYNLIMNDVELDIENLSEYILEEYGSCCPEHIVEFINIVDKVFSMLD